MMSIRDVKRQSSARRLSAILILVSALGYFVDVYDLMLFSVVRTKSLLDLGVPATDTLPVGLWLLKLQTIGLLAGGIFWGILGDRKGRLTVLFGSIILYSLANIANGFIHNTLQYAILRVVAGFGLAGELGAGITIVMETMDRSKRTIGTTIVACCGLLAAVIAGFVGQHFHWRLAFEIGGVMGLLLLLMRISAHESIMFLHVKKQRFGMRQFLLVFSKPGVFAKYLKAILVGIPTYFVTGLMITIAPEFAKDAGIAGNVDSGSVMMFCFAGFFVADVLAGIMSHLLKSRKKIFFIFHSISLVCFSLFFFYPAGSVNDLYLRYALLGFGIGYWALIVTNAAEQFGTNIRATVTTTVPNFVRGALIPITILFQFLKIHIGIKDSAVLIGMLTVLVALVATGLTRETFGRDLDFTE